jgi:MoxR-like ATPase
VADHEVSGSAAESGTIGWFAERFAAVEAQVGRVLLGHEDVVRLALVGLFAGGHILLEGPPGIGKTLLARTLACTLGIDFRRIQFTPDLMPSDVTGGNLYDQRAGEFVFRPGPVFAQVLLADEINRAPSKTQAALLEAMSDRQVTVDGTTRPLPVPFFVLATQNPIESEGTYPLPEAQLDRFLLKVLVAHPSSAVEVTLLEHYLAGFDASDLDAVGLIPQLDTDTIGRMRAIARTVRADKALLDYITALVGRTRTHPAVDVGASPRASIALLLCGQVLAAAEGRTYLVPDDVKELAPPVLRHRFLLQPDAELEGTSHDMVIKAILADVPVPGATG